MVNHYTRFAIPQHTSSPLYTPYTPRSQQLTSDPTSLSINLTKLDVLDDLPEIKVAVAYRLPNGTVTDIFPTNTEDLDRVEPVYKTLPGWRKQTSGSTSFNSLPIEAKDYVRFIEEFLEVRVESVGCGPSRENILMQ